MVCGQGDNDGYCMLRQDLALVMIYEPYIFPVYGNTRYLLDIFARVDRTRYRLLLVAPYEHEFLDKVREIGGEVLVLPAPPQLCQYGGRILASGFIARLRIAWAWARHCIALGRLLLKIRPAVLQCHSVRAMVTIGPAARIVGVPSVWYVKGELSNPFLDGVAYLLTKKVFFQSPRTRDARYPWLRRLMKRKIGVLPNGIDFQRLDNYTEEERTRVRGELKLNAADIHLICVGQISPLKGVDVLLRAFARVRQELPPFRLFFVGDPVLAKFEPFAEEMRSFVRREGLAECVSFLGWRADAPLVTSLMDVLIHPSLTEGFPKAVLEALAQGVPVIASDVGGTADVVVTGRTGILVPARDEGSLAEALVRTCANAAERAEWGRNGRMLVRSQYAIENNVQGLEAIYDSLSRRA